MPFKGTVRPQESSSTPPGNVVFGMHFPTKPIETLQICDGTVLWQIEVISSMYFRELTGPILGDHDHVQHLRKELTAIAICLGHGEMLHMALLGLPARSLSELLTPNVFSIQESTGQKLSQEVCYSLVDAV